MNSSVTSWKRFVSSSILTPMPTSSRRTGRLEGPTGRNEAPTAIGKVAVDFELRLNWSLGFDLGDEPTGAVISSDKPSDGLAVQQREHRLRATELRRDFVF